MNKNMKGQINRIYAYEDMSMRVNRDTSKWSRYPGKYLIKIHNFDRVKVG